MARTARCSAPRALGLALALGATAPAPAQQAAPQVLDTPIVVAPEPAQDAAIAARIASILAELDGYGAVEVAVEAGVVTLTGRALDSAARARLAAIVGRVEGVVAINDRVAETTDVVERLTPSVDRFIARAEQALAILPLLTVAAVAFAAIFSLGMLVAGLRPVWRWLAPNPFIATIYAQVARLLFGLAGLVVALDILGATALLGSILGAAGIIGLAIGFAVRDTVENFIASVMLSVRQPFAPNDLIEIEGDVGKVIRLTSRATILLSLDGNIIRVPNATVFKARLVNFTRNPERRFTFTLDADPSCEIAPLRDRLRRVMGALPYVLAEPAPAVWIEEDTGDAVRLRFSGWIDQRQTGFEGARGEAIRVLRAALAAAGAAAPPPMRRVLTVAPDARASPPAGGADLTRAALADVGTTDVAGLERIVETERQAAAKSDLLPRRPAPE